MMSAAFLDAPRAASATPRASFREQKCFSADSPTPSSRTSLRKLTKVTSGGLGSSSNANTRPHTPNVRTPLLPSTLRRMSTTDCKYNRRSSMGTFLITPNSNNISNNTQFHRTINSIKNENHRRRMSTYWRSFEKYTPFVPSSSATFGTNSSLASCGGEISARKRMIDQFMAIHGKCKKVVQITVKKI
uniref:Uncharacterized protein n=1 Tax=Panagrolaimus sp. PS1159 TaxID=55785 RepID=A0AC35EWY9_9BILA